MLNSVSKTEITLVDAMNISFYTPNDHLKPFVKRYVIIESDGEMVNHVLPETSLVMAFRIAGYVSLDSKGFPPGILTGLQSTDRKIRYGAGSANLLVIFQEGTAVAFIREGLHEFSQTSTSLENVEGFQDVESFADYLAEQKSNDQRIHLVENLLLSRLRTTSLDDRMILAIREIHGHQGMYKISELADKVCMSIDAFEKAFRKNVGFSPKRYASLVRLNEIVRKGLSDKNLSRTAIEAGYFDQSHFYKDFRRFTGRTPVEFAQMPPRW